MTSTELLQGLPGKQLVLDGLEDAREGRITIAACLVAMALPRLRRAGMLDSVPNRMPTEPERELYRLLVQGGGDAYSKYNSLVRELVSFEQALDHRLSKAAASRQGA